jgi:cell division protein FtsZ
MLEDGIQFNLPKNRSSVIKVVGVGGGGSNAVNHMSNVGVNGVDFIVCNTDAQALYHSPVVNKVQLGVSLTEGLGAGADPEIGRDAARESLAEITRILETGTKMAFITAGMGGGTGTGAAPVIAKAAKEMGILTIGIITSPFSFEGNMRAAQAEEGIREMRAATDSLIVINNDKLRQVYGDLGFRNAFAKADEVLAGAAKGIAEVITNHYTQNIDLRDAKTVLENSGSALFGTGEAEGPNRASEAINAALDSPLLNDNHIKGAKNILLLLTSGNGSDEVTIDEIGEITDHIQREAGGNANVIMGIGGQEEIGSRITCTIIATGFPTGTRVLPTDKVQKVIHDLKENEEHTEEIPAEATAPAPIAEPVEERVILDLGMDEQDAAVFQDPTPSFEQEAPISLDNPLEETTTAAPEAEAVEDAEEVVEEQVELATEEADLHSGFPQMPEEDEAAFEQSLTDEAPAEAPMVHVLEWDVEEDVEEAAPTADAAPDAEEVTATETPVAQTPAFETPNTTETETTAIENEYSPLEAQTFDLFGALEDDGEEEIELMIVDEDDVEETPVSTSPLIENDEAFDQPAPAKMEQPKGMIQNDQRFEMPEALETPLDVAPEQDLPQEEHTPSAQLQEKSVQTFTLDDIDGDGFTLELDTTPGMVGTPEVSADAQESEAFDPFEMSLNEMPDLRAKQEQETIEQSFTVPSVEFEKEELVAPVQTIEEEFDKDPDLHFEIKAAPLKVEAPAHEVAPKAMPSADDMDVPLSELPQRNLNDMPSKVKDRISRLQSFQYKFKANQQNLNDAERIPAYMRQGMDVDLPNKSNEQPSNIGVDAEGNLRTNNSFLHDNVD